MKLDLSEILSHVGMHYPYEVSEPPIVDEDLECSAPISGHIDFTNTGNILLVQGAVATTVVLPCSRCLIYTDHPIDIPISEQFTLETRAVGPRGRQMEVVVEDDENPDAANLFDGHLFNLTELLRQGVMLAMPTQPLHDEECKGLCPSCGQDRNEGECNCQTREVNPALARLGELLKDADA